MAFILEDDIEVSPYWYRWTKGIITELMKKKWDENVFGISLQNQRNCIGGICKIKFIHDGYDQYSKFWY